MWDFKFGEYFETPEIKATLKLENRTRENTKKEDCKLKKPKIWTPQKFLNPKKIFNSKFVLTQSFFKPKKFYKSEKFNNF